MAHQILWNPKKERTGCGRAACVLWVTTNKNTRLNRGRVENETNRVSLAADESGAHWAKAPFAILIVQDALLASKNLIQRDIFGNQTKRDPQGCSCEAPEPHAAGILPGNRLKYTFVGVASPCVPGCLRSRKKKKQKKQQPRLHCSNGTDRHSLPHTAQEIV